MDSLMMVLQWVLPTGFLSSVVTWLISRRKQNNDMLSQLQASINMLSTENRKILDENIKLRSENAELKVKQEEMNVHLAHLTKEIERLRKSFNRKQIRDEKQNKMVVGVTNHGNRTNGRMHGSETDATNAQCGAKHQSGTGLGNESSGLHSIEERADLGATHESSEGGCGDDTSIGGDSSDTSGEPP